MKAVRSTLITLCIADVQGEGNLVLSGIGAALAKRHLGLEAVAEVRHRDGRVSTVSLSTRPLAHSPVWGGLGKLESVTMEAVHVEGPLQDRLAELRAQADLIDQDKARRYRRQWYVALAVASTIAGAIVYFA